MDAITKQFQELIVEKDKEIADLKSELQKLKGQKKSGTLAAKEIDAETKEKALEEVQELGKIRRKLEKCKRLTQEEYDKLLDYTNPEKAAVNPRGDGVPERRHKVTMSLQTVWTKVVQNDKEFADDEDAYDDVLEVIKRLVKDKQDTRKDSEDTFRELLLGQD